MQYFIEVLISIIEDAARPQGGVGKVSPMRVHQDLVRLGCDISDYKVRQAFKELRDSEMLEFRHTYYVPTPKLQALSIGISSMFNTLESEI